MAVITTCPTSDRLKLFVSGLLPWEGSVRFGGADMREAFITLSGVGQLIRMRWPEPGLKLNFSA